MKRFYLMFAFFLTLNAFSQSRLDSLFIKYNKVGWEDDYSNDNARQYLNYDTIKNVLDLDVFAHYKLYKQYDTELKRKLFLETPEGINKKQYLTNKRAQYLKQTFMFEVFDRDVYYSLQNKSIILQINFNDYGYNTLKQSPHIQFKYLVLNYKDKYASFKTYRQTPFDETNVTQIIVLKLLNESTALKIEENKMNVRFLFLFKPTKTTPIVLTFTAGRFNSTNLEGTLVKVIAFNKETKEIYFEY